MAKALELRIPDKSGETLCLKAFEQEQWELFNALVKETATKIWIELGD